MAKYIELIDKYRIDQSQEGSYNPPSYIWVDNTGEVIRCGDCVYWSLPQTCDLIIGRWYKHDYCSKGVRKKCKRSLTIP